MHIRPFEEADTDEVIDLWTEVFPDPEPRNEPRRVIRDKLRAQRELFFVAVVDGAVVGTAMAGYDGRRGWVYAVAVRRARQKRGIGAALMQRVEEELRERGCAKINLQVEGANREVVGFYERIGFRVEERVSMGRVLGEAEGAPARRGDDGAAPPEV